VIIAAAQLVAATPDRRIGGVVTYVAGAGVVHDLLWAPALALAGALTRFLPGWVRVRTRVGLALSALCVLVTWPVVRGYAKTPRNPSILPLDYAASLRVGLVLIWLGVLVSLALHAIRRVGAGR
jgi:hypothetical protein